MFIEIIQSLIIFSSVIIFMFPIYEKIKKRHYVQVNLHKKICKCFMNGTCKSSYNISYEGRKVYIKKPSKGLNEKGERKDEKINRFFKKVSKAVEDHNKQ
jgi:hypothetical protein